MLVNRAANREWTATDYPGIERSLFRRNETGGRASIVRLTRGSRFPRHEEHDVVAQTDASIFVSSQKGTPVVE